MRGETPELRAHSYESNRRFECVCVSLNDMDGRILSPTGAQDTAWTGVENRQRGKIASRGSGAAGV